MAEVTIRFRHNPKTGKRELIIGYESDSDALAHEHERDHRAMVERILGMPLGDDDEVVVERISKQEVHGDDNREQAPAREKAGEKAGG
jgi:hypothetical protein